MAWIQRFANLFRQRRLNTEFDAELASHLDEAVESGRSAADARRAVGNMLVHRERMRDVKLLPGLDALAKDIVFGSRQLRKHPTATAAAILSLALAIGGTTAAFRLVDAVLLRKLPVADPAGLFYVAITSLDRENRPNFDEYFDYPTFRRYRDIVADRADLMVIGMCARQDAIFGSADETEKVYRQFLSGNVFGVLGLQSAAGRLLTPNDDVRPGGHPVAVLSYDFWTRRFARDPAVLGKTFRLAGDSYEVIGVAPKGFTGTEPGELTDVFIPAMMNADAVNSAGWSWFRAWLRPKPGYPSDDVRQALQAALTRERQDAINKFHSDTPKEILKAHLSAKLLLFPAGSGASEIQKQFRRPLLILSFLVGVVLLLACANVGNLMTARAATRAREMALRISIGAGRSRLLQLLLVESALLAVGATIVGAVLAAWSAPVVVSMLRVPQEPVRLVLHTGWRELGFMAAVAAAVTLLFGLAPALRASGVEPIQALKGGGDPRSRQRTIRTLLAAQIAFCVLVLFVSALFVATFHRLSTRPLGFDSDRVLAMDAASAVKNQPVDMWLQVADHLRAIPGVESVGMSAWPLLSGNRWTSSVHLPGRAIEHRRANMLDVSPGFFETMGIGRIDGREFRRGDVPPRISGPAQPLPGVGVVNEAFARTYFSGQNPVGNTVNVRVSKDISAPLEIIGYVRDAVYNSVREVVPPTVYVPMVDRSRGTFLVRTAGDPRALAGTLRLEVSRARSDFDVRTVNTQREFVNWHLLRERLLAALSLFFATVALVLAAVGLYAVLNYSVNQQRREIGIRLALGARSKHVVQRIAASTVAITCIGSAIGLAAGLATGRVIESLLFEVKSTDIGSAVIPVATLFATAILAALPPAMRAVRTDPAKTLRED